MISSIVYFYFSHELSVPFILIVIVRPRRIIRRGIWYYLRTLLYIFRASTSTRTVALINVHLRKEKKIIPLREKQLLQIATVPRYIYITGAWLRDPRYSIRIVNGDNAQWFYFGGSRERERYSRGLLVEIRGTRRTLTLDHPAFDLGNITIHGRGRISSDLDRNSAVFHVVFRDYLCCCPDSIFYFPLFHFYARTSRLLQINLIIALLRERVLFPPLSAWFI